MAYYSGHSALHPSGQLKLFKIVPDDFVTPSSKHQVDVTPAKRGKGRPHEEHEDKTPEQQNQAMIWAQRLKRVFNIKDDKFYIINSRIGYESSAGLAQHCNCQLFCSAICCFRPGCVKTIPQSN
jgi:hypothetical protein